MSILRPLVVLPTYNERASLPPLLAQILRTVPAAEVLVVDDDSPDGTGEWADDQAVSEPRLHVIHRPGKQGLGSAYMRGFAWGLEQGFDVLVEMDADGSHRPRYLPDLLRKVEDGADLAIGSRWVEGGGTVGWPFSRLVMSKVSNFIAETVLHMHVKDATAGFRAYRAEVLRAIDFTSIEAEGYAFQIEGLFRVWRYGGRIEETPITFTDRICGSSKISRVEVLGAMTTLGRLWISKRRTGLHPVKSLGEVPRAAKTASRSAKPREVARREATVEAVHR